MLGFIMTEEEIYTEALELFGREAQLRQAQEEAAELIVAINHYLRGNPSGFSEILEEITHVKIMLGQLEVVIGKSYAKDVIGKAMDKELTRLENRIKEYKIERH